MAVVDISVALKWFVIEEGRDLALSFIGGSLFAPDLILVELANAGWKKWRQGAMDERQFRAMPPAISDLVTLVATELVLVDAVAIAMELDHPVYDCCFLALAAARDLPLLTFDRRLGNRCRGTRFESSIRLLG